MTGNYKEQLQSKLSELFQFSAADLDFGIYRIMNHKREEIKRFIEEDLIEAVDAEFEKYSIANKEEVEKELTEIRKKIDETVGKDAFEASGEIKEEYKKLQVAKDYSKKKEELDNAKISEQHKAEIFSHIYHFFSRYYQDGDFLSLRRYSKQNKYAVPYNGEEVLLHWANKDQYYIKTGEYFRNYTFRVGDLKINFRLSNAEIDKNNNKSEKRFFVLKEGKENIAFDETKKELTVFFEYRGIDKDEESKYGPKNIQENIINSNTVKIIDGLPNSGLKSALERTSERSEEGKTLLQNHLSIYIKKNTTDYFIHKDLKGFLERELDFYLKNEVLMLDDLGGEKEISIERYITRIKVIKEISKKVIEFLAQIEDFQKKLWEKKKFVVKTDYCMTLDNVPEELYPEILKNKEQLNEWKVLYGVGEEKQSTITSFKTKYIEESYLKEHPYLVLDTKFFNQEFKDRLLTSFDDIDEAIRGLMIKSENWQALNLMQERYRAEVKCIYIDPPYNTGNDEFIYRDNYQHSSWLTMMENRLQPAKELMTNDGAIFTSIDDGEEARLNALQKIVFGDNNFVSNIIWQKKFSPQNDAKWFSDNHDFVTCFAKNKEQWRPNLLSRTEDQDTRYKNIDNDPRGPWTSSDLSVKTYSAAYDYPIVTPSGRVVNPPEGRCWFTSKEKMNELIANNRIWFGEDEKNVPRLKRFLSEVKEGVTPLTIWTYQEVGHNQEGKQELKAMLAEGEEVFGTPKVIRLMNRIFTIGSDSNSIILDFFAGSGTTAHAILNLNDENSNRKYILVEMGDYFDTVMKPRIQKAMYSKEWKDGKPQPSDGISHIFKYQYLEQYEDTLNNIEFTTSGTVQKTLGELQGYFLRYMLDFETRGSSTRLNTEMFKKPFEYKLKITNQNETEDEVVDLVETFNYLLGLHIKQIKAFNNNGNYYRVIFGNKNNETIAIIWRNNDELDLKADKEFIEGTVLREFKPQKVYVNGDSHLENAFPIEPEFKKLMGA